MIEIERTRNKINIFQLKGFIIMKTINTRLKERYEKDKDRTALELLREYSPECAEHLEIAHITQGVLINNSGVLDWLYGAAMFFRKPRLRAIAHEIECFFSEIGVDPYSAEANAPTDVSGYRKCQKGIEFMVRKDNYPNLPSELEPFAYYYLDGGHCICAVPECFLEEAKAKHNLDDYEVPIPVKFVLEKGYRIIDNHVICDAPYDDELGLITPETYSEY